MPKAQPTSDKRKNRVDPGLIDTPPRAAFVELGLASCFSFLRGASDAADLVLTARMLGYDAIGIADTNSMAGVVRVHTEANTLKLRPVIGCRIETVEGLVFLAYPADRAAYGRLCRLISTGRMTTLFGDWQEKGACEINLAMLAKHAEGVQLILVPPKNMDQQFDLERYFFPGPSVVPSPVARNSGFCRKDDGPSHLRLVSDHPPNGPLEAILPYLVGQLPSMQHIAASYLYAGDDIARIETLDTMARDRGLSLLATNDVLYHAPERRPLQDVMTAIRHKTTVARAGLLLEPNAERHLKSPEEMVRLFSRWPHAIEAARKVADACRFSLEELKYEYPEEICPGGLDPQAYLERLTWDGAKKRYPKGLPSNVKQVLEHELELIGKLQLARYFLTIKDIVDFARRQEPPILCQGRGSAANSAVCYCLEITSVDPAKQPLLFDRFISEERKEPPDIDVDFEHERREEVIQYIYKRYARTRAGLCATVIHYRPRMAIREVGKAMGLSEDVTGALARTVWGSSGKGLDEKHASEAGVDLTDPYFRRVLNITGQLIGMPRHLSQHVGGFILSQGPLIETVPIGNGAMPDRSFIEWDKDDIDDLGILKVDVLALGMLTCIRKCLDLLKAHHGRELTLASIPREDPEVYAMLCKGDSLGVFQVESRAQMNMLPRLRPSKFYDLVIQVAIVRPGPIQGNMVHPFLKRRCGEEPVVIPAPGLQHGPPDELSSILERTLGVPIFQEQAMKIALDAAKFTSTEANRLRKAMATFRSRGKVDELEDMMVEKMVERGYERDFAQRCFNQIRGFGEYGFPESHAASFAHLVYVSSWLKCHFPAAFACGLLNSQPMGFYAPAQIVRDARDHGVTVLSVDVNHSLWDCTLEELGGGQVALRLGLRQIDGFPEYAAARLIAAREEDGVFVDVVDLHERTRLSTALVECLANADAFSSLELSRRQALWDARSLISGPDLPLFAATQIRDEGVERAVVQLPVMPLSEEVVADYQTQRLSLKAHPMAFLRPALVRRGFLRARELRERDSRSMVHVSGVVLNRQRPGSAKGVCFLTLEDETGVVNVVVWPDVMEKFRKTIMSARLMEVRGRVECDDDVLHVIAVHLVDATGELNRLFEEDFPQVSPAPGDQVKEAFDPWQPPSPNYHDPGFRHTHPRNVRIIPKSRDFH